MFVVTVRFSVHPEHADHFRAAMLEQARNSLDLEPGCHQFDVATDADNPTAIFLYELYTDKAAFDLHLASPHFEAFDKMVSPWVEHKSVQTFTRIWPSHS